MILEVDNLSFRYRAGKRQILKNISFTLEQGDFLAIIGSNGAGKSSLGYAVNGLIPHFFKGDFSGQVLINGIDTQVKPLSELVSEVGLIFQNPLTQLSGTTETVFEELAIGLENYGLPRKEMVKRITEVLKLMKIEELQERLPFALSGGQQQKVAIASILVMQPKILILDEPTSQLDPGASEEIFQLISALRENGTTIILIEHKIEEIAEYADQVMVLADGEIKLQGRPGEILHKQELSEYGLRPTKYAELGNKLTEEGLWKNQVPVNYAGAKKMVEVLLNGERD